MNLKNVWNSVEWQRENGFAVPGDLVVFENHGGSDWDRAFAIKTGLVEGEKYEVEATNVEAWSSDYKLKGFSESFNTCMFEVV